jgi:hypothetical protein
MKPNLPGALRGASVLFLLIALLVFPAHAQTSRGTVSGTVMDSSGAVVPGSTVELNNPDTGVVRTTTTNGAGIYRFDAVDLGRYKIKISMQGFKAFLYESFPVEANRNVTIDATLELGGIEAIVEVTEGTLETSLIRDAPLRGGSMAGIELTRLPFAWSEPYFAGSYPGIIWPSVANFTRSVDLSVNGQRPRGNNFMLDGSDNNDPGFGGQAQQFMILDAVQESSVQTGNFGVEFGRAGGGVFNIISKSGTNEYHGTLNWRFGSQVFDSMDNLRKLNTPPGEEPKKPVYTENIYGFTFGGPIIKDKTFFFGGFQQGTRRSTNTASVVLPTEDAVTKLKTLFLNNPRLNLYLNAIGSLRGAANPIGIVLGRDPATNVDRGIVQFASSYYSLSGGRDWPWWILRLDHNLSNVHCLSFRYIDDHYNLFGLAAFPGYTVDIKRGNRNFLLTDNYTLSPSWTNEFRFSYVRNGWENSIASDSVLEAKTLPWLSIPNVGAPGMPYYVPQFQYANKWLFQATQSKLVGRHAFRYGFEFVRQLSKQRPPFNERGILMYQNSANPVYSGFANYLDDFSGPSGISIRNFGDAVLYPDQFRQSYFFQDSWKVKPSFTFTLGLRYENYGAPANNLKYPAFAGFDPAKFFEPNKVNPDNNNFGPSFGFAWSPSAQSGLLGRLFGDRKTVWRGGFQVSYDAYFDNMLADIQADAPNSVATTFISPFTGRGAANFFSTLPTAPRPVTLYDQQTSVLDPNIRNPYTERWSFGFQRQLPQRMILDLSYVGSASHKLFTNEDLNVRQLNEVRLYPDFGIRQIHGNSGNSNYHAMQLRVERRFAKTFVFTGSYTWSRMIDSTSEIYAGPNTQSALTSMPVSQGGLGLDRGLSDYSRSHALVFTFSWDIPRPKSSFLGNLAGGWTLAGMTAYGTGAPYTVLNGFDRNNDGIAADRPDIGNLNAPINTRAVVSNSCSTGYLDPDTNVCVAPNDVHFVQGVGLSNSKTLGKNTLALEGGSSTWLSILKAFSFKESRKLEFGLEMMNAFNNPGPGGIPNASVVGSPGPSGGMPSRFLNKDYTNSATRTMNIRLKLIF